MGSTDSIIGCWLRYWSRETAIHMNIYKMSGEVHEGMKWPVGLLWYEEVWGSGWWGADICVTVYPAVPHPLPQHEHKAVTVDIRTLINCMLFPTGSISTARAISVHDNIWWHRDLLQVMETVLLHFRLVALCPSLWITSQLHWSRDNMWTGRLKNLGHIPG